MKTKFLRIGKSSLSVVLSMMIILSTMLVGSLSVSAADTVTVYFKNTSNWSTVNAHIWKDGGANLTAWPGNTMEKVNTLNGKTYTDLYSITFDSTYDRVIFSNSGSNQTDNLTVPTDDKNVYVDGTWMTLADAYAEHYYIEGRFMYKATASSSPTYLGGSAGTWTNNSTDIRLVECTDADKAGWYKLETNCTLKELTTSGNNTYYFWIRKGTSSAANGTAYEYSTSGDKALSAGDAGTVFTLKTRDDAGDSGSKFYFNDTSETGTVVIYFNPTTKQLYYDLVGVQKYTSTVESTSGGTASVSAQECYDGQTVTVTTVPNSGYKVDKVTVTDASGNSVAVTQKAANTFTYTMPASDVTVNVTFVEAATYTVSVSSNDTSMGTAAASKSTVTEGDTVTLTAAPKSGYRFVSWNITGSYTGSIAAAEITITPNSNITATATFAQDDVSYYINGRFSYKTLDGSTVSVDTWADPSDTNRKKIPMTDAGNGLYKLETASTVADLTNANNGQSFFYIAKSSAESAGWTGFYPESGRNTSLGSSTNQKYGVQSDNSSCNFIFSNSGASNSGNVTLWFDSVNNKFYYTTDKVTVIAKDGTIRTAQIDKTVHDFSKYANYADTTVSYTGESGVVRGTDAYQDVGTLEHGDNRAYKAEQLSGVPKGTEITIQTTINEDFRSTHYVKAFCINGLSYSVIDESQADKTNGVYTCTYTIPEDTDDSRIEITPIYFCIEGENKDNYITFYVEGFDDTVKEEWGATLACYVWYANGIDYPGATQNELGGFPGQPMVYEGGRYYMQVPKYLNGNTANYVKGTTLSNYTWDTVHVDGTDDERKAANCQTYDYDDFAILSQRSNEIIFRFKYRTKLDNTPTEDNFNSTAYQDYAVNGNGWEELVDYYNRKIDIFGNVLTEEQANGDSVYIVSDGSAEGKLPNYIGKYSTRWYIYKHDGTHVATVPPSTLLYKVTDPSVLESTTAPADFLERGTGFSTGEKDSYWQSFVKLYKGGFLNVPAEITYEKAIDAGDDPALRNDGRWYYSEMVDNITANVKIQYKNSDGSYVDDAFTGTHTGTVTGADAFFTNTDFDGATTMTVAPDNNDHFKVKATSGDGYTFAGWYLEQDGVYTPLNSGGDIYSPTAQTQMTTNATLVARYIQNPTGTLTITHNLYKYAPIVDGMPDVGNGSGTVSLTVNVLNSDGSVVDTYTTDSGSVSITPEKLAVYKRDGCTIQVTLGAVPEDGNTFNTIYRKNGSYTAYTDDNGSTGWKPGEFTDNKLIYTCSVADLFDGDDLKSNTVAFYSDFNSNTLNVKFKYYDRKIVGGKPTDISSTPTVVSVDVNVGSTIEDTIVGAYQSYIQNKVGNVTDQYYFWTSQSEAESAISTLTNYHTNSAYGTGIKYHTDHYGNVQTSGEKWVTYYGANGSVLGDDASPDKISSVVVWGFNTPKTYKVNMIAPTADDTVTSVAVFNNSNDYFTAEQTSTCLVDGFYNQRLGSSSLEVDTGIDYLKGYGIGAGQEFTSEIVTPVEKFTCDGIEYVFDGWYNGSSKISSDRNYLYRITQDLTLTAVYRVGEAQSNVGLSVFANTTDHFVDANGNEKVRFNTQLNIYGCEDDDEKLNNVAMVYIILGNNVDAANVDMEQLKTAVQGKLSVDDLGYHAEAITVYVESTAYNGTMVDYTYTVRTGADTDASLTNKNRAQFTLTLPANMCEEGGAYSKILALAAIKYDGIENWIVSDNYVSYINGDAQ